MQYNHINSDCSTPTGWHHKLVWFTAPKNGTLKRRNGHGRLIQSAGNIGSRSGVLYGSSSAAFSSAAFSSVAFSS